MNCGAAGWAEPAGRGVAYVHYPDPMHNAYSLFNIEDFSERCVTDPDLLDELIRHFAEACYAEVAAMAQACAGLPIVFYAGGPEVATPSFKTPSPCKHINPNQS